MIKLTRPIIFFDLETTGTEPMTDRIVEMSFIKLFPNGDTEEKHHLVNPLRPIPADAMAIHGIRDEDVAEAATFQHLAKDLHQWLQYCDLGGYNLLAFDVPCLFFEFFRAGITWNHQLHYIVDAGNIFKIEEPRTLTAAMKLYCGTILEGAHSAVEDNKATMKVLMGQLAKYEHLPQAVEDLATYSNYGRRRADVTGKFTVDGQTGEYLLNFGQHRGQQAKDHLDFLTWMCMKDFPADAQKICRDVIAGKTKAPSFLPQPPAPLSI